MASSAGELKDSRRHRRYAVDAGTLQVSWLDLNGRMRVTRTRALNISEEGMAVELPEAAMPLLIRFQSDRFKVRGVGAVRYCRRNGPQFIVGLEFTDGLHWRSPQIDVHEPIPVCDPEYAY
jgi:hypothetical protein